MKARRSEARTRVQRAPILVSRSRPSAAMRYSVLEDSPVVALTVFSVSSESTSSEAASG